MTSEPATVDELLHRYRSERDKRLRDDGSDQYIQASDVFAPYADPHTEAPEREPIVDPVGGGVTFIFVGGGFAGLSVAARLSEAGHEVRVVEKGGDFGGTWYWNRYPGAQCDTAAMVYMPLLEETGYMPTQKYARGPEILEHCRRIGHHFDLYRNAILSTAVTSMAWDEGADEWVVETNRGDKLRARYVGLGIGTLHRAKLPGLDGIADFKGHSFHTSRWDYAYTGGDPSGTPMDKLADKRVGIIGTGPSAVQSVPSLATDCGDLYVFQRTPSPVDLRNNQVTDPDWFGTLKPGWQDLWRENFTTLQTGGHAEEDLVKDCWTDISLRIRDKLAAYAGPDGEVDLAAFQKAYDASDHEKMAEIRARVDAIVNDPATAAALKPWYRQLCKRPCFNDEYLPVFNRSNVHLIDTEGRGVEQVTATGLIANGVEYELDCIIYASGFDVAKNWRRFGFEIAGRDGRQLGDHWSDGMRSLHGIHVHGFPNAFVVGVAQGANLFSNVPHNLTERAKTITAIVNQAEAVGATRVEVTEEAETAWVDLLEHGGATFGNDPNCTPGYYNNEGQDPTRRHLRSQLGFPDGPVAYFAYIDGWRSNGRFSGLEFDR